MIETYTKARFWKCALQINPVRYIKYRGEDQKLTEVEYDEKLINGGSSMALTWSFG